MDKNNKNVVKDRRDLGARIGTIIRRKRELLQLTQTSLAETARVTQAEVSYIERGERSRLSTLENVSGALGMRLSELIYFAEEIGDAASVRAQAFSFTQDVDRRLRYGAPVEAAD